MSPQAPEERARTPVPVRHDAIAISKTRVPRRYGWLVICLMIALFTVASLAYRREIRNMEDAVVTPTESAPVKSSAQYPPHNHAAITTVLYAVPPMPDSGNAILPVHFSLALEKDTYELDEYLAGTGSVVNPNSVPVAAQFTLALSMGGTIVKTAVVNFPCNTIENGTPSCVPAGTTTITPAAVLSAISAFDRIPANPDLIGEWTLAVTSVQQGETVERVELPFSVVMPRPATITVDAKSDEGTIGLQGFVRVPRPSKPDTKKLMALLEPQQWRVFLSGDLPEALSYGPKKLTYSTEAEYYALAYRRKHEREPDRKTLFSNPPAIAPWKNDYALYREYIVGVTETARAQTLPSIYLGFWNDMDSWGRFGTDEQMFDTFKVFHDTVRSIDTDNRIKIEAPTTAFFDESFMRAFLDYAALHDLRVDAVSWHTWDPGAIARDVQTMKTLFARNPRYCTPKCPELHINEYNAIQHYFIPGWQGAYLAALEQSDLDFASGNSCFKIALPEGRSMNTCYTAYMGMFMEDNETPQALYWVRRGYAAMQGTTKLKSTSSSERTVALASKSDTEKTVRLLVSRYSCGKTGQWCAGNTPSFNQDEEKAPAIPVTLTITDYPYAQNGAHVVATVYRIPNEKLTHPFTEAELTTQHIVQTLTVGGTGTEPGTLTLSVPAYQDGDVYYVTIK